MVPTIRDRLATLEHALLDVIIPAIPVDEPLALEQAHLSLMQLRILRGQVDIGMETEVSELRAAQALLDRISPERTNLADEDHGSIDTGLNLEETRSARIRTLDEIDRQVSGVFAHGSADDIRRLQSVIVAFQRDRKPTEDRWFGAAFAGKS